MMELRLCNDAGWLCSAETYAIYAPCMYKPTYEKYVEKIKNYLDDPKVRIYVCEDDGIAKGTLVLDVTSETPEIIGIAVDEKSRGQGIGCFMIRQVMQSEGVDAIKAETDEDSVEFYRRCGFEVQQKSVQYPNGVATRYDCLLQKRANRLERMGEFFDARLEGYEEHQLATIEFAEEFYPFTAKCLPQNAETCILDLGCGTGLELEYYFESVPTAKVTGVDLAAGMLDVLKKKFPDKPLHLIVGSYFEVPFDEGAYDAAVSVESLHHFTKEEKIPLYEKVRKALKADGYFILTDYFATSEEEERFHRGELLQLKKEQGLREDEFYHYDTPLTAWHETEALLAAGFTDVQVLKNWGHTYTLKAVR